MRHALMIATAFVATICTNVDSAEVNLTPTKDATLYESTDGTLANGGGGHLFAGRTGQTTASIRRGLLAFDIASSIPLNSEILDVSLRLNMSKTISGNQSVSLHRVTQDWGEGESVGARGEGEGTTPTTNDATWLHSFWDSELWTTSGGDFAEASSATIPVGTTGAYLWSSATMTLEVQSWLENPETNFGWVLLGDESVRGSAKRFDSHNNTIESRRPVLSIEFIEIIAGDLSRNGILDGKDIDLLCTAVSNENTDAKFDLNADGLVSTLDQEYFLNELANSFPGDTDLNGVVEFPDFLALSNKFGRPGGWANGDFDCNQQIQFNDFLVLSNSFGQTRGEVAAVPEPSGLILLGLGMILLARITHRFNA